jgi:NADH-quinone oxidoreductase subunit N
VLSVLMNSLLSGTVNETPLDSVAYKAMQSHVYSDFFAYFMPETILLAALLVMLTLGISRRASKKSGLLNGLVAVSLIGALAVCLGQHWDEMRRVFLDFGPLPRWGGAPEGAGNDITASMLSGDGLSHFFRIFLLATGVLTVWMASSAKEMRDRSMTEFHILFLGSLVGMMLLASASHMLMVYLAIEMMSLPSYVMVALRRKQRRSTEASLKYMLFGSVASGAMVYGLSLIYGMTGGLSFSAVAEGMSIAGETAGNVPVLALGLFLFIIGLGYKMAIAPMHFWCPDAYEGAPTPVTAFLSVASKAAGFAAAIRFVWLTAGAGAAGSQPLPWVEMLAVLGILTMTIGNLAAIRQSNIKRMLAYSSVAHAGYMLIGLAAVAAGRVVGDDDMAKLGVISLAIYLVAYLLTNYGAFATVVALENQDNDNEDLTAFRALGKRNLLLAVCMFIVLLSLLGVPPTVGFFGKFWLFWAGLKARIGNPAIVVLLIAAAVNTAISAYYYFKVVREMFLVSAERGTYRPFTMPLSTRALVGGTSIGLVVLFVMFSIVGDSSLVRRAGGLVDTMTPHHQFKTAMPAAKPGETGETEGLVDAK